MTLMEKTHYSAWAEVDLRAIRHNYRELKKVVNLRTIEGPSQKRPLLRKGRSPGLLTVIKADAYGHGMLKIASTLDNLGVSFFGVSDVTEGVTLRKNGFKNAILLFESTLPSCAKEVVEYNLTPTVCTRTLASSLNTYAKALSRKADIHIKIDTGMGRLGIWYPEAYPFIRQIAKYDHLSIKGLYTHFPVADTDKNYTKNQIDQLYDLVKKLDNEAVIIPYVHAANSMGLVGYKSHILNLSRPGLMLYGLYPANFLKKRIKLDPAMSVKAKVIFVKKVIKGRGISYGHTFVAESDMMVATLPIGYSNGYMRCLSNKSHVLIQGKRCPVIGNVTMDQIMIDVSRLKNVKIGSEAVILGGQQKEMITADELARHANTINYEIVCSLGNLLPRVYLH